MILPYSDELADDAADVLAQIDGAVSKPRLGVSGRMTHAELSELLPIDTNWGDPLTPDIALHIVYAAIAKESEK